MITLRFIDTSDIELVGYIVHVTNNISAEVFLVYYSLKFLQFYASCIKNVE